LKRLLIAAPRSGCGKTTVTCALLAAFKARGLDIAAFKSGPDYIDPMFHRAALGVASWNLDPFFLDEDGLCAHLERHAGKSLSLIEGAMGYYDGIAFSREASAYTVARATETPVVLVIDVKGVGNSALAILEGFINHRADSGIRGVLFNNASEALYEGLSRVIKDAGIAAYGFLPRRASFSIESRHLGLMTAQEIPALQEKLAALGREAEKTIDVDGLLALAGTAPDFSVSSGLSGKVRQVPIQQVPSFAQEIVQDSKPGAEIRLGVARDEAFCFHYTENFELFEELGCRLVFFSPLRDKKLPEKLSGLYLAGGYPELYVEKLSQNTGMREEIRRAIGAGLPTIAECGGFLFLHETLDGFPMAAVIKAPAFRTEKLQRFGYVTLTANADNVLCKKGESIRAHEFHYWESAAPGEGWTAKKGGQAYPCIHGTKSLYAGFPHLYLYANPAFAGNFTRKMRDFAGARP
jgi:cobyrinic acid a,c-diamide synthase